MADSKITALTSISTSTDPANDPLVIVDVSDTSMAATGTTKKVTLNQLLGASGTATLASATITGDLTVDTNTLKVDSANNRVGIGTASPAVALDVVGSAQFTGNLTMTTGSLNSQYWYGINATSMISSGSGSWPLLFGINGSEKARIDASGNCGIGVTPSAWDTNYKALQLGYPNFISGNNGGNIIDIGVNAYFNTDWKYAASSVAATRYRQVVGVHQWFTAPSGTAGNAITWTQAMTLDASGILLIGTTNNVIWNTTNQGCVVGGNAVQASRSNDVSLLLNRIGSNGKIAAFARDGLEVGDISVTTTGTTFNSTSDYRLKEAVAPLSGGLARVNALKPSIYKWKSNGSSGEGFLAHELAEVVPAAVSGEKDALNEDGSIKAQSVDMSRVVPILVAAIQELAAEVNALKNA